MSTVDPDAPAQLEGGLERTSSADALKAGFEEVWDGFLAGTSDIADRIRVAAHRGASVHDLIYAVHGVPYWKAKELALPDPSANSRLNPGPLTGLFFERFVNAAIIGYLQHRVPGAHFFVGMQSPSHPNQASLPRDPDLCVEFRGRNLIFEFKTSPKRGDLEYVQELRERYGEAGLEYLFIGGEVFVNAELLRTLVQSGWVAFLAASNRNMPIIQDARIDNLLRTAERWLLS